MKICFTTKQSGNFFPYHSFYASSLSIWSCVALFISLFLHFPEQPSNTCHALKQPHFSLGSVLSPSSSRLQSSFYNWHWLDSPYGNFR